MELFDPRLYGARWAENYDEWHKGLMDDEGAVATLFDLAGGGPVLEFAVGTGRLAVPLAERGAEVVGVDISPEMLAKLAEKSPSVTTVEADMTTVSLGREFALVYIAFNSIFALETQEAQVELFRNAAAHLRPGGQFVLETAVVRPPSGERGQLAVTDIQADRVTMVGGTNDPVTGQQKGMWLVLEPDGPKFFPICGRQVSHFEMDLMAQLAGLRLESRRGDWKGAPFTAKSELHISTYRKP
ncbi:class I SAM-dependent methyltransferase [Actinophytocola sp.]|uniref:class I SAM-dependent methyltransferase n=1 Tax=Actinophytocola sp. TaxID=1872138 RepID=UPI00389A492A